NAERFIQAHRETRARFVPVGVIQGVNAQDYAKQVGEYLEMGYDHLALGGLVPRDDNDIDKVVTAVTREFSRIRRRPWLHLLGIYRPSLQIRFRHLGVNSFDSATYFRKAWLRSDQNYLATDGTWYAAIRVPPTRDARMMIRLKASGLSEKHIKQLETR